MLLSSSQLQILRDSFVDGILGFFWGGWEESHSIVQASWYSHTGFALTAIPSQFLKCRNYRTKSARDQKEFCRNRNYTFVYTEINSTEDSTS